MVGKIIDGRGLADKLQAEMALEVAEMAVKPGLVVIIVGDNQASQTFVRNKEHTEKNCINSKLECIQFLLLDWTTLFTLTLLT